MNLIHIFNSSSLVINHPVAIFHQDSKFQNREQVTLWFPWWGSASVVVFILYTSPHGLHQVLALFTLTPLYAMMACYVCSNAERWSESSFSLERKNITAFPLLKFWSQIWMFMFCFETASKVCRVLLRLSGNLPDRVVSNLQWHHCNRILVYVY